MAEVFGERSVSVSDYYLNDLLDSDTFWAIAAFKGNDIVGGLTAHTLPMIQAQASEIFIYDIAVVEEYQRKGIGRQLLTTLFDGAAKEHVRVAFVLADNIDTHALDFYRAMGASPSPTTAFTFSIE